MENVFQANSILAVRVCEVNNGFAWAFGNILCSECAIGKR